LRLRFYFAPLREALFLAKAQEKKNQSRKGLNEWWKSGAIATLFSSQRRMEVKARGFSILSSCRRNYALALPASLVTRHP
jgi:hypothetical protein